MRRPIPLGLFTLLLTLIGGLWLIYAPFAYHYQPVGADWVLATRNDLVVGIVVAGLSAAGIIGYLSLLLRDLLRQAPLRARDQGQAPATSSTGPGRPGA